MTTPKIACVVWQDAHGNALATYEPHEVPHSPAIVQTYGVIVRQDETGISIAGEVFEAGSLRGLTFIPKAMVKDVLFYHAPRPKRPKVVPRRHARAEHEPMVSADQDSGTD